MASRELSVLRINYDYNSSLLDGLAQEAIKPFGDLYRYNGVKQKIQEIKFDSPIGKDGIALWTLGVMQKIIETYYRPDDIVAVMPYRIMGDTPVWAGGRVVFLSTYPSYLDIENKENFIGYGKKLVAFELGLSIFQLERHQSIIQTDEGYCLMTPFNDETGNIKEGSSKKKLKERTIEFLDKMGTKFCDECYQNIVNLEERLKPNAPPGLRGVILR